MIFIQAKMMFEFLVPLAATVLLAGAFRPGNETGLTRREHVLELPEDHNVVRFRGILKGSLFFDLNFYEAEKIVFNLRAFPWGDVDYEGREIIDMWSSNGSHLAEEAITKRNAGPALPNLPIKNKQDKIDIRIQFTKNFYGEDKEVLMFIDNSLHWRETLPKKINFDKVILSEAVAENAGPSKIKALSSLKDYEHPESATRPQLLAFGPPLSKYQKRDAIWGMTPLQVKPGDRYQLQIKGEVLVKELPNPLEMDVTLLTNYSSFRTLFDEPYLAKLDFKVINGTKATLITVHREHLGGAEYATDFSQEDIPQPITDHSFQFTFQRDLDRVAAFVDINGVRLKGEMLIKDGLDLLPAHMLTILIGKPEEHWLAVTEVSEKYIE